MKTTEPEVHPDVQRARPLRQATLQALLFAGAAFSTALLTFGGPMEPKLPPLRGE